MTEAVLKAIWKSMNQDNPTGEPPSFETALKVAGKTQETRVNCKGDKLFAFGDASLAGKVAQICSRTANNLYRGEKSNLIRSLTGEVQTMNEAVEKPEASLNSLVLKPLILRTRCDLCPA